MGIKVRLMETADIERMKEYIERIGRAPNHTVEVLTLEERRDLGHLLSTRITENERS